MGDNKVIAIKIFYSPAAPLFCKVVLQKVATVSMVHCEIRVEVHAVAIGSESGRTTIA